MTTEYHYSSVDDVNRTRPPPEESKTCWESFVTKAKILFYIGVVGVVLIIVGLITLTFLPTSTFSKFPFDPTSYEVPTAANMSKWLLEWNTILSNKSDYLLRDEVLGPESLAISGSNGKLYTGLKDGRVVEIDISQQVNLTYRTIVPSFNNDTKAVNESCGAGIVHRMSICGRPLGMRFDSRGRLVVVDAVFGLHRINVNTGQVEKLIDFPPELAGFYNDLVIDPEDDEVIYVSLPSRKWSGPRSFWSLMEHESSGIVVGVSIREKRVVPIVKDIYFSNGVEMSSDGRWLLISQLVNFEILKVRMSEVRTLMSTSNPSLNQTLQPEPFAVNLPGEPDNIREYRGNVYVGFVTVRLNGTYTAGDWLSNWPLIRRLVGRISYIKSTIFTGIYNYLLPFEFMEKFAHSFTSGSFLFCIPKKTAVLVLDGRTGQYKGILGSDQFAATSEAIFDSATGDMYHGSFANAWIGRLPAKDIPAF